MRKEWIGQRGPTAKALVLVGMLFGLQACHFATPTEVPGSDAGQPGPFDAAIQEHLSSGDLSTAAGPDATCARQSATAERLPLDLYVMMDSSGSMLDPTSAGVTKWDAVRTALVGFLNDPQSAGIGVGIQYFPQLEASVPAGCATDADCGNFGPCFHLRTCAGPGATTVAPCAQNSDCARNQTCAILGACAVTQGSCAPAGQLCGAGDPCNPAEGYCLARDRCDVPPYATPAVAIAALPQSAPQLVSSLAMHEPDGLTPTAPALTGALQVAQRRAAATPDHKVAVLLVTDGFPSECVPADIPGVSSIAAGAAASTPAIPTFVIGVFGPAEASAATMNLNALAQAGGTGAAVIITTAQNVSQALQTALNQIRTTAVACEYRIPPASGGAIDFGKVNVELTSGTAVVTTLGHVNAKANCDARGGWYYDVDPATGAVPSLISACDATCTRLRADAAGRVDIVLGCQTLVIP